MFSIEQLEAFIATVECGSFSSAARKLGKVQSAISQHVMNLEIDCNSQLFERQGRYPVLTPAGHKLLPYAQATVQQHKRLVQQATGLSNEGNQQLTLALDEGILLSGLTSLLAKLEAEFPLLELECLSASSKDVIEMIESGRATCGLIFSELVLPDTLDFESIGSIKFDVYVSSQHALAQSVSPHIDALRLHRQLAIRSRNHTASSFHQPHSPDVWYADNYYLLLDLAIHGFGWCLLPTHLAHAEVDSGRLVRVPVAFEQLAWYTNVDVIQLHQYAQDSIHRRTRELLRQLFKGQSQ
ncbi:LysR family transcriptional regulator [Vibrio fluvialis]|uniref:LysR family transcriptional regulator n=1 Tax=Vibrio fluvialis TaxID=676 RepID=UPI0011217CEA|nr:LysR family transcriptional regulator [Vibrio fluvialis]TOY93927.1 LysR family transcriptional regulator [Vibrio fluvialis]TRN13604.1 LysR family transcriptional regulator [Vibrio fluvialis]